MDPTPVMKVSYTESQTRPESCNTLKRSKVSRWTAPHQSLCPLCRRTGADWGHCQVWLRGPKSQRAVLQEGSLPVTLPASVWGLVGGPAQRCRWADSTSVHCGAGHVSGIYFNCEGHHWIRFVVSVKSHSFSTQRTNDESQLRGSTAGQQLLLAQSLFMLLYFLQMPFILPFS